jgi:methyl-accepting chemotaxis protein
MALTAPLAAGLSVGRRFALLVALCGIAILVPAVKLTVSAWTEARTVQRELDGLRPVQALNRVVQLAQQHRGLSAVWLGGKDDQAAARAAKAAEVQEAIDAFEAQLKAAATGSPLQRHWDETRSAWAALRDDVSGRRVDGPASSARHTAVIARMLRDLDLVLDHWGLLFDSDPGTYFVMVGALQETPRLIEIIGQMRARGANLLSAPDKATPAQRASYGMLADHLGTQFDRVMHNLRRATEIAEGDTTPLKNAAAQLAERGQAGIAYARRHVVEPETLSHPSTEFYAETTRIIDAMYGDMAQFQAHLEAGLLDRVARGRVGLATMAGLVVVLFGLAIGVAVQTGRWLGRRLGAEPDELNAAATRVAAGDLMTPLPLRAGDTTSVLAAMSQMQRSLARMVGGVRANAAQVAVASSQIAQGNQDLSSRTESQASSLQQTAASMEQLRTTIGHSADSARQASQLANRASEVAGRGGASVGELAATMARIQASSKRIADIIGTIDGIAFQTNILALNAAVEAARAGEQGRGFAVVAGEVRALARRSADAAREIRTLIADSVERVEQGSRQGDEAAATMQEVVQSIQRVNDLIGEVSAAAQQQNAGVTQVSTAVSQMDEATQRNAALVEQSAAAAESLRQQAAALQQAVAIFRTEAATA